MPYDHPGVYVVEVPSAVKPIAGVSTSTPVFVSVITPTATLATTRTDVAMPKYVDKKMPAPAVARLFTNWTDFTAAYGGLSGVGDSSVSASTATSPTANQHNLALAVYGFFNNGGSRCYVTHAETADALAAALTQLEAIDDISLVVAPGVTDKATQEAIIDHCANCADRFAILDGPSSAATAGALKTAVTTKDSDYAALYAPWITVVDPAAQLGGGSGIVSVPPSGHIAGVYARVDDARGVHKAPANEVVYGAVGVAEALSRTDIGVLNPGGINCLRVIGGNVTVWGARTLGGDANADLKYVNVRRTLIFLRQSIEAGTQWIVFEPNNPELWQKITRNVGAFLTTIWRSGALFGNTAQEAFYVKCDAETNPAADRDNGFVTTEIGVALTRPAEFVVFRISQTSGS